MKTKAEVLDMLEECMNTGACLVELLGPEDFRDPQDYWTVSRAITSGGSLVEAQARRSLEVRGVIEREAEGDISDEDWHAEHEMTD